jgi:hypothetical protein
MVVKGIVEDTFKNQAKVRIPVFDKVFSASLGVDYNDLSEATMCVPPKFDMNVKQGDIVYILFEDNNRQKPVIIGFVKNDDNSCCNSETVDIAVSNDVILSNETSIGNVDKNNIKNLVGINKNIQIFLNTTKENVNNKETIINNINNNINNININNINNNINILNNNIETLNNLIGKEDNTSMDNTLFGQLNFAFNYLDETLAKIGNVDFNKRISSIIDDYLDKIKLLEEIIQNRRTFN